MGGEPKQKMGRIEEDSTRDADIPPAANSDPWPKPGEDGPAEKGRGQGANRRKNARRRKEEYRQKAELRKKKERLETLRRKGEGKTRNQPKISIWLRRGNGGKRGQPVGGKTGAG